MTDHAAIRRVRIAGIEASVVPENVAEQSDLVVCVMACISVRSIFPTTFARSALVAVPPSGTNRKGCGSEFLH